MEKEEDRLFSEYVVARQKNRWGGDDLKSKVYRAVEENLEPRFLNLKVLKDNKHRFNKLQAELDGLKRFSKFVIKEFSEGDSAYSDSFLELIEPLDRLERFKYIIFSNWDEFIVYNNGKTVEELSNLIIYNLFYLGIVYKRYLIRFYKEYSECTVDDVRKYFEYINEKTLKDYFFFNCRLNKDVFNFDEKELELMPYKLLLRISSSFGVPVDKKDPDIIKDYFRFGTSERYPEKILIIHGFVANLKERIAELKIKTYKASDLPNKDQVRIAILEFKKQLFDKSTKAEQVKAFFNADFDYLTKNKLVFNSKYKLGLFWYLIDQLADQEIFKVHGIYNSLDSYQWLIYEDELVFYTDIKNTRPKMVNPLNSEVVDVLISKLVSCK